MGNIFNNIKIEPYLYFCDGIITEVNKEFVDFTDFTMDELVGKSLIDIGTMLKITPQILLDNVGSKCCGYIFTKSLDAREVSISLSQNKETNQKKYTFIEKPNSRLKDKLIFEEQTFNDNISGMAIYSVPGLLLLKSNQKYLDFKDSPFNIPENSIGRPIRELIKGFVGSQTEIILNTVLRDQKSSHIKDTQFNDLARGITYWDSFQTPIFQNGKIKYILETVCDVTEKVLRSQSLEQQNKIIGQQREQLEQHNIQLMSIIKNLSEGVIISDNKSKIIMTNPEAKKLLCQDDNVITVGDVHKNTKAYDMEGNEIPLDDFPEARALKGEKVKNTKMMFVNYHDKKYFMEVSSTPIYNTNRDLTVVVSCFNDITKIIEQSRKIEEQKKEFESIIENIADGIAVFDNKGQYVLFNKTAREMVFPYYEYMDNTNDWYKQFEFYDSDGERINSKNTPSCRVMRGERFKNIRMTIKFPHKALQIVISGTPIYNNEGEFTLGVFCIHDMTNYFKHEEDIKNRHEFMNRMIDNFNLPVIRLSCPDLKIMDINKKAFSMIKSLSPDIKSINQIEDNKIEGLFEIFKSSGYYQCISKVLKDRETTYLNKQKHLVKGNEIYLNVIFDPMLDVNGEIKEILIIIVDVTTEINSNIGMEKALKSQGEFLANISHDLKTPLNVICATAQLFSMYCSKGSLDENKNSIIKYIDSITQNSYRLSKLINNIVDSSKIESGFFELHLSNKNIVEVVEEIVMSVTNFTDSKGLNIIFDTNLEEKIIACDTEKVERVVLNLISNAIKFSKKGDEIFVEIKANNEFVEISVKDNGIGIEEKNLTMIFDRFKQVDRSLAKNTEGTGIGLSLVKSIAELHGGSIHVESELGKGSKFTVVLPSKKVVHENILCNSTIANKNKSVMIEFSDVLM